MELFTWLIEITEDATEVYDGARIVWSARFEPHQEEIDIAEVHKVEGRKSTSRFEIQKDDIQAVVPISKNWEVLNTAVLTGQQVSQAMKVFIVSQAGKAADVTFQASCHSEDESVLKVSSSCGSVYVDGSEARGSVNGSVLVKYGTYTGLAQFTVWMPEFPLELAVADTKLSQLKSWRVPDYHPSSSKTRRKKRSYGSGWSGSGGNDMGNVVDKPICRLRYQQTSVDVYAHFFATDHDSGRTTYLINRRTWLRVTDLVLPWLRVSDPRIASLHGRILQGRSMGRTEVQVLSPITSRVYGSKEIRVGNDKVGLTRLSVQVVSGLQLNISPDGTLENVYVAETGITRKLTAQYQEGLLDISLEFSDRSKTPLRDISDTDYHLVVESLDPEVVAFAPMVASHHPRVIAVGEGSGDLLQITLLLAEECRTSGRPKMKAAGPLATAAASITVDFSSSDLSHRPDILQNDGDAQLKLSYRILSSSNLTEIINLYTGTPLKDENYQEPNSLARQYSGNSKGILRKRSQAHMTPLEISMYVLLAAFCCAIVVFVVSCVVYASKFKPIEGNVTAGIRPSAVNPSNLVIHREPRKPRESTTNAHDWVWLGRATLDNSNRNSAAVNNNSTDMRIITNPLNMNYAEPEDCLAATSFSNPTHIELPSKAGVAGTSDINSNKSIDTSTYCKSKIGGGNNKPNVNNDELQVWTSKLGDMKVLLNDAISRVTVDTWSKFILHVKKEEQLMWDLDTRAESLVKPVKGSFKIQNKPTPPPPLPPHGVFPERNKVVSDARDEYRPPVPPHRNIGITATSLPSEVSSPRKIHHHHHHHSRSQDKSGHNRLSGELSKASSRPNSGLAKNAKESDKTEHHIFEFDDEPCENSKKKIKWNLSSILDRQTLIVRIECLSRRDHCKDSSHFVIFQREVSCKCAKRKYNEPRSNTRRQPKL
ncbi:hypothetical protein NQ317_008610 [Molorchus minor]|uniref:Transmembrane protein 132E n=1 Tax=Molorchus minor TaxID=1323400 RepID=A0ABQ9JCX1_9CUCU|nr:hypothetical protein NQ317_008610 [Molorchus minor]